MTPSRLARLGSALGLTFALAASAVTPNTAAASLDHETVLTAPFLWPALSLALANDGTPHVVFSEATLRYGTRERGTWRFENVIENRNADGIVRLDAHDRPSVFFVDTSFRPQYAVRGDAGWTVEFIDRRAEAIPLAFAIDGRGRPHVLWTTGASSTYGALRLFHAVREGGAWLVEPVAGSDGAPVLAAEADLALDREGEPVVAYAFGGSGIPPTGIARRGSTPGAWSFEALPVLGNTIGLALRANGDPVVVVDTRPGFAVASQERGEWVAENLFPGRFGAVNGVGVDGAGRPVFSVRKIGTPDMGSQPGLARSTRDGWSFEALDGLASEIPLAVLPSGKTSLLYLAPQDEDGSLNLVLASDAGGRSAVASEPAPRVDVVRTTPSAVRLVPAAGGVRLDLAEPRTASVEWYDVRGRRVASEPSRAWSAGTTALQAPLARIPRGLYFVRVATTLGEAATARVFLGGDR